MFRYSAFLLAVTFPLSANSQSFISKLPADSLGAIYKCKFVNNEGDVSNRSLLTIRCVGTKKTGEGIFRWLEIQHQYLDSKTGKLDQHMVVNKLLVNESKLGNGDGLVKNSDDYWMLNTRFPSSSRPVRPKSTKILDYYQPKLGKVREARKKTIQAGGREYVCKGSQFELHYDRLSAPYGQEQSLTYTVYHHKDAPFGTVEMTIEIIDGTGKKSIKSFKLSKMIMNAKAKIPLNE